MTVQADIKAIADQVNATIAANNAIIAKLQGVNTTLAQTVAFITDPATTTAPAATPAPAQGQ